MKNNQIWTTDILAKTETAIRFQIKEGTKILNFKEVFNLWKDSAAFRLFYQSILTDTLFSGIYWEHPALKRELLYEPYECVILNSNSLDRRTLDQTSFAAHFDTNALIVNFNNLGKNARLVVPTPQGEVEQYKHLVSFLRSDKIEQQHELWKNIGQLILQKMDNHQPIWLNTAGNGVIWLHVRLDSRPKYYKTRVYKNPTFLDR